MPAKRQEKQFHWLLLKRLQAVVPSPALEGVRRARSSTFWVKSPFDGVFSVLGNTGTTSSKTLRSHAAGFYWKNGIQMRFHSPLTRLSALGFPIRFRWLSVLLFFPADDEQSEAEHLKI